MTAKTLSQKLFEKGKVFTVSNGLSTLRLFGGFYLYTVTINHQVWLAIIVTLILTVTDFLDGYFARRFNQVSELGKVLDPLADKIAIALGMIALYQGYGLPFWIVALIIGRDIVIVLGSLLLMSRLPYVTPSAMPGKIAVTIIALLFLVFLLGIKPLQLPLLILTLLGILVSSGFYAYRFFKKLSTNHTESDAL